MNDSKRPLASEVLYRIILICWMTGCILNPVEAEDSRIEEITKKKEEKSQHLAPYVPTRAELILRRVEKALTMRPNGFYPFLGSVYTGGLLAAGPGYSRPFGDNSQFDIHAAWSIENYRMVDTSLILPMLKHDRLTTTLHAQYLHAGKVPFYGLGNDTSEDNKTRFEYRPTSVDLVASYRLFRGLSAGGGVEYLKVDSAGPEDPSFQVAGAGSDPVYTVTSAIASYDYRSGLTYSNRGGYYRMTYKHFHQHGDADPFDFQLYEGEVDQFIPILRGNQVLALQAFVTMTDADAGNDTPYYMMPYLGGSHRLRGYPTSRFRDRNRLLLTAEYRWAASKFLDAVAYFEAGKVAARKADINFENLHYDVGIGLRFHSPAMTALRIELAKSEENLRFIFTYGPTF